LEEGIKGDFKEEEEESTYIND
jgi:hypothetical protein